MLKPGVHWPQSSVYLAYLNGFCVDVCMCVSVCPQDY